MNIIEAIKQRRSVRSFDGKGLSSEELSALRKSAAEASDPFGGKVSILLKSFDLQEGFRPSTYGFIKGATDFFLLAMGADEASALSAGFRFEEVVLNARQMGLGTCWIAGTFKDSDFERGEKWPDGETLKVVCPVGIAAKQRLLEKVGRYVMGSKNRKPFAELFFSESFDTPLSPDSRFGEALEMMRLAPSSTNSQPWRALVAGNTVHFYTRKNEFVNLIDCGIGMRHFYDTELFHDRKGSFRRLGDAPESSEGWAYLCSYIAE